MTIGALTCGAVAPDRDDVLRKRLRCFLRPPGAMKTMSDGRTPRQRRCCLRRRAVAVQEHIFAPSVASPAGAAGAVGEDLAGRRAMPRQS